MTILSLLYMCVCVCIKREREGGGGGGLITCRWMHQPWWPVDLRHWHRRIAVSQQCPYLYCQAGMWKNYQRLRVSQWFSPGGLVSSTSYDWVVTTWPQYRRKVIINKITNSKILHKINQNSNDHSLMAIRGCPQRQSRPTLHFSTLSPLPWVPRSNQFSLYARKVAFIWG